MHGLSSIVASRFRCKLKNLEFQTNGGSLTWYAPTATPLIPYFNPIHQPKTPVFTQKNCHPKSCFFHTVQNFGNCSLKDPKSAGKKVTKCPSIFKLFYGFCHWKTLSFLPCMHASVWGECCSLKHSQKLENFVFLRQNRANLVNTFRCKFNKGDENKISVLQAQPTQLLRKNFIGGQGWYKHGRGYILQPSSVWFCTSWFSKQMPSVPEAVPAEAF